MYNDVYRNDIEVFVVPKDIKVTLPDMPKKRFLVELPLDVVKLIDDCSKALGFSRSAFLSIFFRTYDEHVIAWTEGFLQGYYYLIAKQDEDLKKTQKSLENLGVKTYVKGKQRS